MSRVSVEFPAADTDGDWGNPYGYTYSSPDPTVIINLGIIYSIYSTFYVYYLLIEDLSE